MAFLDWLTDLLGGGKRRRLRRAVARLEAARAHPLEGDALDRFAGRYLHTLRLALRVDPACAVRLMRAHDGQISADRHARAFTLRDEPWLARLAQQENADTLTVVFELADRIQFGGLQRAAGERLAAVISRSGDANRLIAHLLRCQQVQLLAADLLTRSLRDHVARCPLENDAHLWSRFFATLPEMQLPDVFEVHQFLGRGADAVRLARTVPMQRKAVACCQSSARLEDVFAGLELARRLGEVEPIRCLQVRAGDLLFEAKRWTEALDHYRAADCPGRVSECQEHLGQLLDALLSCPAEQSERLAALAGKCLPGVDALIERQEYLEAAWQAQFLVTHLARATEVSAAVTTRRVEAASVRAAVLAVGRQHLQRQVQEAAPAEQRPVFEKWSAFEETAGDLVQAAQRAEDAGDVYRAHRLFRQAGLFGDAVRVLEIDTTPAGLASRAGARADGGDLIGAARLYEQAGQWQKAADLFQQANEFAAAARCLRQHLGDEASESAQLADCLRRGGAVEELATLWIAAVRHKGRGTQAADQLRRLLDATDVVLPAALSTAARTALDELGLQDRRAFEERIQSWVARARAEVDRRYAGTWGFDLGTTTCSAAIYDSETGQVVLCPWKNHNQFASTLSLDEQGNELVGLAGEEIFAHGLVGHISAAKRKLGTQTVYRIRDRSYRPEEVAARLIRHARGLVEGFLAARVRERVGALAHAELGEVPDDWLYWAEQHHDLRLSRSRTVVTIPAYFHNNQKHGTRDACQIAGVEVVRLLHEPTAACMAVGRARGLSGRVVVVDLGAGTLDVSYLDVSEGLYEVRQVLGDNQYGGKDHDAVITQALVERLRQQERIEVPANGLQRKRLEVAAEQLKIELSFRDGAEFLLRAFTDAGDVRLELSRADLEKFLAEPLRTLRKICNEFKASLKEPQQHLVLVGGPMLSPLVHGLIEQVFGQKRTGMEDPRTAVACGAALQAAVLDGKLKEILLLDVTPLPLGIRALEQEREILSVLVEGNTRIPVERQRVYTTTADNQPHVQIEVFQGKLDDQAKIGQFNLEGIRQAKKGEPQIEVKFAIDASCVLEVTARDQQTGVSNSIRLTDTTLLSPFEREAMARRFGAQQEQETCRLQLRELLENLGRQLAEADGSDSAALVREWRSRMAAYRPSPTPLEAATQQALVEMFNKSNELESELLLTEVPLRDLAEKARAYLERAGASHSGPAPLAPDAVAALLAEGQHLAADVNKHLDRLRPLRARLAQWNGVLVSLASAETDPLRRFLACHEARDYGKALAATAELPVPLSHLPHVLRYLDCLAQAGDDHGYRRVFADHAASLHAGPIEADRPLVFAARARQALAHIRVAGSDGRDDRFSGFFVSDRLVATNQRCLVGTAGARRTPVEVANIEVFRGSQAYRVDRIFSPRSAHADVAVLRLVDAVDVVPFRLGYANLVQIGDRVWAVAGAGTPSDPSSGLIAGLVNKCESFLEWNLRVFKVGLAVPAVCSGGPLFNGLGEVVGVLTIREQPAGSAVGASCFALNVDALEPPLAAAGLAKWPS